MDHGLAACAAAAVFLVQFVLFYRLILFHFYIRGAMLSDTGLLGSLLWHNFGKYGAPVYVAGPNDALADLGAVIRALEDHLPLDESDYMEAESENAAD
jgi:hypothetical protein